MEEVADPRPRRRDVVVSFQAASVHSANTRIRGCRFPTGMGIAGRLVLGWNGPRQRILGTDGAGVVEFVGAGTFRTLRHLVKSGGTYLAVSGGLPDFLVRSSGGVTSDAVSMAAQFLPIFPAESYPQLRSLAETLVSRKYDGRNSSTFGLKILLEGLARTLRREDKQDFS